MTPARDRRPAAWALAVLAALALVGGCGDDGAGSRRLTVFAAASLTETFTELGKDFEAAHAGTTVVFNFGASSTLAQQITAGAPADVFAAANPATMKAVSDAGKAAGEPRVFVRNQLVIAVRRGNPATVARLADLARPGLKVALCAEQVPCGAAARTALAAAGVKVTPVTLEQDVKATLTKVRLGEVDAALVYRTDVKPVAAQVDGVAFAESAKAINDYPIVAVKGAANATGAAEFATFVTSALAQPVFSDAGFLTP